MSEINIDSNGVLKLLSNIDPSKAAGPDGIQTRFLKEFSNELYLVLSVIFEARYIKNKFRMTGEMH